PAVSTAGVRDRQYPFYFLKFISVRVHHIVNVKGSPHREPCSSTKVHHIVNAVHSSCYLLRRQYERTQRISTTAACHSPDLARSLCSGHSRAHSALACLAVQMAPPFRPARLAGSAFALPRSAASVWSLFRAHPTAGCSDQAALA